MYNTLADGTLFRFSLSKKNPTAPSNFSTTSLQGFRLGSPCANPSVGDPRLAISDSTSGVISDSPTNRSVPSSSMNLQPSRCPPAPNSISYARIRLGANGSAMRIHRIIPISQMRPCSYLRFIMIFTSLSSVNPAFSAELVKDDLLKIEVLKAAFPHSKASVSHQKPLDWKPDRWPGHELTDALKGEQEYEVVGSVDKSEEAYAMGVVDPDLAKTHETRRLRVRVYEMNSRATKTYVALAHYTFTGITQYPFCCQWFARLFVLSKQSNGWNVQHTDYSLINRAKTIRSFQLVDLNGDGHEEILFEGENTATGYRRWIALSVFGIVNGNLMKVAEADTLSTNDAVHTQYGRELDLAKTRATAGKTIFFKSTVYGTETQQFLTPRLKEEAVTPNPTKPN
jgi:hypothetical protein